MLLFNHQVLAKCPSVIPLFGGVTSRAIILVIMTAFYLLYTASGSHANAIEVIRNSPEGLVYKACDFFARDYGEILPLSSVLRWKLSEDMSAWLDSVLYHSFVRYSVEEI